ncbi:MAG: family 43 glycosylhydrolase [Eubacteriales bacterium]|nr:family 43 glycosylhydrolase [Eubacteriales bacterium]
MKKKQLWNPYLPLNTYIPDGEPHVFGDRLYIFGSHDQEGGTEFCMLPYECWSAPLSDLSDFRCEGTIYEARQDPAYSDRQKYLYAPDVVQGNDGRFYLYYAMAGEGCFTGPIRVAVSDTPGGRYTYYGTVQTPDGKPLDRYITFDPAVLNDNGNIWLYYGWSLELAGAGCSFPREKLIQAEMMLFGKTREEIEAGAHPYMGANAVQLQDDMLTVLSEPSRIVPGQFESGGTDFEGHAFFEASSMRKIGDRYYFIYSSQYQHELCYAVSRYPDRDFVYGGTIISNGDIGRNGRKPEDRLYITGNNHGSLVQLLDGWYIFYHRHTHKTTFSRQGCAEKVFLGPDGRIAQAEMTSSGLNGGPLETEGRYPAVICCNLTNGHMPHQGRETITEPLPHVTHRGEERFLAEIGSGTRIGYKYFSFAGRKTFLVKCRGNASGFLHVCADEKEIGKMRIEPSKDWREYAETVEETGVHGLFLIFEGEGLLEIEQIGWE